jgi:hypothetical protein
LRTTGFDRNRDAGGEGTSAHRHHHRPHLRQHVEDLQPARAIARDHGLVVEGGHEAGVLLLRVAQRRVLRLVVARPDEVELHRVLAELGDLGGGGVSLDEQLGPFDPEGAAREGDAERVVARRSGDDAAAELVRREREQLVERATRLEGPRVLAVLLLQPELDTGLAREERRALERRLPDVRRDSGARGFDVGEGDAHAESSLPRRTTSRTRRSRSDVCVRWFVMQTRIA